jgi:hypothetical protein
MSLNMRPKPTSMYALRESGGRGGATSNGGRFGNTARTNRYALAARCGRNARALKPGGHSAGTPMRLIIIGQTGPVAAVVASAHSGLPDCGHTEHPDIAGADSASPGGREVINLKEWMRDTERMAREPTRLGTGSLTLGQLCRKPFGLFSLN